MHSTRASVRRRFFLNIAGTIRGLTGIFVNDSIAATGPASRCGVQTSRHQKFRERLASAQSQGGLVE